MEIPSRLLLLELPAGRGRPCLWLFFVRAEWLGTVRTLITNPKAFQTQANQHVNFRNFGFVGAVWPKFSKFSANRFILSRVLISWETSYLANNKNPKSIRRPDLSLFGFPRCDFRDYLLIIITVWHVDFSNRRLSLKTGQGREKRDWLKEKVNFLTLK